MYTHTGLEMVLALLLLYCVAMVPVQLAFWDHDNACITPRPTLYFDMFVDVFFLVSLRLTTTWQPAPPDQRSTVTARRLLSGEPPYSNGLITV